MNTHAPLTEQDKAILDFEGIYYRWVGAKEDVIRERFDMRPTAYYQRLNALIDHPDAAAHAPATVRRLREIRVNRYNVRSRTRRLPIGA